VLAWYLLSIMSGLSFFSVKDETQNKYGVFFHLRVLHWILSDNSVDFCCGFRAIVLCSDYNRVRCCD